MSSRNPKELLTVETDPTGRFVRSGEVLSRGASRVAYKGQDGETGDVVAWNQVSVAPLENGDMRQFESEVKVLKGLSHKNILKLHACWIDEKQCTMNYVTEYFNPGPLRRHRKSRKRLSLKAMREWTWQILQGLLFLHEQKPPMIHKDLKCDTVFIHGTTGDVKIANLGLASLMEGKLSNANSIVGSPEFMAPELINGGHYDSKVDVYSFGMLLLELATQEFPYRECKNTAELMDCLDNGRLPQALFKVHDVDARDLIEMCILHDADERPESKHLLGHPFFDTMHGRTGSPLSSAAASLTVYSNTGDGPLNIQYSSSSDSSSEDDSDTDSLNNREYSSDDSDELLDSRCRRNKTTLAVDASRDMMSCELSTMEGTEVGFELCVVRTGNLHKRVKFMYDVAKDNVEDVVDALEKKYDLVPEEKEQFRTLLYEEVGKTPVSCDMISKQPSVVSSIFTDGQTAVSEIWTKEDTGDDDVSRDINKTTSTFTDIPRMGSVEMSGAHSPTSKDFWQQHKGHDVSLGSYGNAEKDWGMGVPVGKDKSHAPVPGDWDFKVVTMGPNHGSHDLNRASVDSKDHRGFCDAFLPKWVTGYSTFMDGATAVVRGMFWRGGVTEPVGQPQAQVVSVCRSR